MNIFGAGLHGFLTQIILDCSEEEANTFWLAKSELAAIVMEGWLCQQKAASEISLIQYHGLHLCSIVIAIQQTSNFIAPIRSDECTRSVVGNVRRKKGGRKG